VDDEEEEDEVEERSARRKKRRRKERERSDDALDEEDLDLIGGHLQPREAPQVLAVLPYFEVNQLTHHSSPNTSA